LLLSSIGGAGAAGDFTCFARQFNTSFTSFTSTNVRVWRFAAVVDRRRGWRRKQAVGSLLALLRSLLALRGSLLAFTSTNVR
jgi:hypothetical protein